MGKGKETRRGLINEFHVDVSLSSAMPHGEATRGVAVKRQRRGEVKACLYGEAGRACGGVMLHTTVKHLRCGLVQRAVRASCCAENIYGAKRLVRIRRGLYELYVDVCYSEGY